MRVSSRLLPLVAISVLMLSCDDSPTAPNGGPVGFQTLVKSTTSAFIVPEREVIRDAAEWARVWALVHAGQSEVPPVPGVDFEREMVVLAARGESPNSCFDVDIDAISLSASPALDVQVSETEPAASCGCLQVLTQPVHAVRVERIDGEAGFRVRQRELRC